MLPRAVPYPAIIIVNVGLIVHVWLLATSVVCSTVSDSKLLLPYTHIKFFR